MRTLKDRLQAYEIKGCHNCLYIGRKADAEPCKSCIKEAENGTVFNNWKSEFEVDDEEES